MTELHLHYIINSSFSSRRLSRGTPCRHGLLTRCSSLALITYLFNESGGPAQDTEAMEEPQGNVSLHQSTIRGVITVVFSMTLGIVSNIVGLFVLIDAYLQQRRRSKPTFLLFAASLVVTDFFGHVIPGALVIRLYLSGSADPVGTSDGMCQFLGGCMVFFGLCSLFMGCAMAAERCLGVTRPLLHASLVTTTRIKVCLAGIWLAALCVALLPCFHLGSYTYQEPATWCFIKVLSDTEAADVAFVALFSGLGLAAVVVALVCNTVSGLTLVLARMRRIPGSHHSTNSHDIEMVVQLVGVMATSCICWCPLLIIGLMLVIQSYTGSMTEVQSHYKLLMTGVRLAAWNQILDPWVYILLRRTVLRKIYLFIKCRLGWGTTTSHWETSSFASSDKNGTQV